MKIKKGFVLRNICGQNVVSGEGIEQVNFSKLISLNDSATYLWNEVRDKDFDAKTLTDLLLAHYEVDEETAARDARKLFDQWTEFGLLED